MMPMKRWAGLAAPLRRHRAPPEGPQGMSWTGPLPAAAPWGSLRLVPTWYWRVPSGNWSSCLLSWLIWSLMPSIWAQSCL